VGAALLIRSARRDPDNWRIDAASKELRFNHWKEVVLALAVAGFLLLVFVSTR
jgi:hypothetical protein